MKFRYVYCVSNEFEEVDMQVAKRRFQAVKDEPGEYLMNSDFDGIEVKLQMLTKAGWMTIDMSAKEIDEAL